MGSAWGSHLVGLRMVGTVSVVGVQHLQLFCGYLIVPVT